MNDSDCLLHYLRWLVGNGTEVRVRGYASGGAASLRRWGGGEGRAADPLGDHPAFCPRRPCARAGPTCPAARPRPPAPARDILPHGIANFFFLDLVECARYYRSAVVRILYYRFYWIQSRYKDKLIIGL